MNTDCVSSFPCNVSPSKCFHTDNEYSLDLPVLQDFSQDISLFLNPLSSLSVCFLI